MKNNIEINQSKKTQGILKGCLTILVVFFILCAGIGIIMSLTNNTTNQKSGVAKYIDVTDEQSVNIEEILKSCGIEKIKSIEHDELLDNAHIDGEKGYRIS